MGPEMQRCFGKSVLSNTFCQSALCEEGGNRACTTRARCIRTLVHGDDYASVGSVASLRWLKARLEENFDMKTVIAGQSQAADIVTEAKILNRVIRATSKGWEYECDQRHA